MVGWRAQQRPRHAPYTILVRFGGHILDRRFAIHARQEQPRQQMRGTGFQRRWRLPCDAVSVSARHRVEAREEATARLRRPQAFQQQMVETERQIERRITPPRAFGVEEDRPLRTAQNVLGADIAMHQRTLVGLRRGEQCLKPRRQIRMGARGGQQVRLQPDRIEDLIGGELPRHNRIGGRRRMNAYQPVRHGASKGRIGVAVVQLRLPQLMVRRVEEPHGQRPRGGVLAEQVRRGTWHSLIGAAHPARLIEIAAHRRPPIRSHAQLRQRPLHADRTTRQVDAPDIRRHAARQRHTSRRHLGGQQSHPPQRVQDVGRRRFPSPLHPFTMAEAQSYGNAQHAARHR
jgi:hypothetical protein